MPPQSRTRDLTTGGSEINPSARLPIPHPKLLVIACSARALAQSIRRAGWAPCAIDQFGDEDLRAVAETVVAPDFPRQVATAAARFPNMPCLFGGGVENHPELLETLETSHRLLGNSAAVVRAIRDPYQLGEWLAAEGFRFPPILSPEQTPTSGIWLKKPLRSGGGRGIQIANLEVPPALPPWPVIRPHEHREPHESAANQPASENSWYWQPFLPGTAWSAQFVGNGRTARLWGLTRQLVGCSWAGAQDHWFVGNVGPYPLGTHPWSPELAEELQRLGSGLAARFQLQGLFGVDGIRNRDGWWTLEVNPRYTAAMELLEQATETSAATLHIRACEFGEVDPPTVPDSTPLRGKAVVYARCSGQITPAFHAWVESQTVEGHHPFADIPALDTPLESGMPICTVFAAGNTDAEVERLLQSLAQEVYAHTGSLEIPSDTDS